MTKNKSNLQDIELSIFERMKSKMDIPLWLKIVGGGLLFLIVLTTLGFVLLKPSSRPDKGAEKVSPTPLMKQKTKLSSERRKWQAIKSQLDRLDSSQKDLLPPEIDLDLEFEQ